MSNMGRNNDVAHVPAKAGSATSREPLPFRGGLDVAPMPRATVDEVLAKLSWIEDQARSPGMSASKAIFIRRTFDAKAVRQMPSTLTGQGIRRKSRQMGALFAAECPQPCCGRGGVTSLALAPTAGCGLSSTPAIRDELRDQGRAGCALRLGLRVDQGEHIRGQGGCGGMG